MSEYERQARRVDFVVTQVQIRAAYATRAHGQGDLTRAWHGIGQLALFERRPLSYEDRGVQAPV